jgi:hypothetical protein
MGFPSFFRPTPLPSDPSSAIAYREESHSVVLLDMLTGQERDRLNLGSARPAVGVDLQFVENQAWVVCSPSTDQPANLVAMIRIEEDRLSLVGSMVFPQAIASAPEFDPERRSMLAVARESTLYSVSLDRRQIEHVFPLGHEAGSIRLRPVLAGRFLFIVERKGVDSSVLRTFILQEKDGSLTESTGLPIDGELDDAPIVRGGRLFWASDRGERKAFELGSENDAQPLTLAATASDPEADPNTPARLLSISESEFWVLTRAAKKYRLVVERKELSPTGSWPLVGPARRESRVEAGKLVAIAQDESLGGIVIQGLNDGEPQPRWSTQLGSQAGTLVAVEGPPSSLLADWGGNVVTVSPEEISAGALVDKPFDLDARRRANPVLPISPLGAERALGLSATGRTLRRVLPDGAVRSFSLSTELTGQVARLGTGLLVPSPTGYAYWVSLDDGSELADPFAAPFRQGSATPLQACRSIDPDQPNAGAWAAGGSLIFRLEWGSGSTKLWQEKFRIELPEGTDTQEIHPAGELLWVVTPNALFVIDTQTKAILGSAEISLVRGTSRIVGEKLVGIDGEGQFVAVGLDEAKKPKLSWRSSLTIQPLPRWDLDAGRIVAALTNGELVGWNSADGTYESIGKVACSLRDGPIRLADTWVGVASDGSLVSWPKQP